MKRSALPILGSFLFFFALLPQQVLSENSPGYNQTDKAQTDRTAPSKTKNSQSTFHQVAKSEGPLTLKIIKDKLISLIGTSRAKYNFGSQSSLDDDLLDKGISHIFEIENNNNKPVIITDLETSSISAEAQIGRIPKILPLVVPPKGKIDVVVSIDPKLISPGDVYKSIWVRIKNQEVPAATLEMVGTLNSGITFSEQEENFGNFLAGSQQSKLLTVTFDPKIPRYLPPGDTPRLVSTNPDIEVKLISKQSWPDENSEVKGETITQEYQITPLRTLQPGRISGRLFLTDPASPNLLMLKRASIPLAGMASDK